MLGWNKKFEAILERLAEQDRQREEARKETAEHFAAHREELAAQHEEMAAQREALKALIIRSEAQTEALQANTQVLIRMMKQAGWEADGEDNGAGADGAGE